MVRDEGSVRAAAAAAAGGDKGVVPPTAAAAVTISRAVVFVVFTTAGIVLLLPCDLDREQGLDSFLFLLDRALMLPLPAQLKVDPGRSLDKVDRVAVGPQAQQPRGEGVVEAVQAGVDEFELVEVRSQVRDAVCEFGEDRREVNERRFLPSLVVVVVVSRDV